MLVRTVLYNPAPRNPSKFKNNLLPKTINSLLHLQVESKKASLVIAAKIKDKYCNGPIS